ncbi:MAG TPA: tetratricopeptide repeat protein [Rhizomicrobium sp.]|jgi:tetratricopeptide (TPR) repeat protein
MSEAQAGAARTALELAAEHLRRAEFAAAEAVLRDAIARKPANPQLHYALARALIAQHRLPEGIEAARAAIRLKPGYAEALAALGEALHAQGDAAEAEKAFRAALRLQPNFQQARQGLAVLLNDTGRPRDAESLLRQSVAAARTPRDAAAASHNLGVSLRLQRRYAEAVAAFDSATRSAPDLALPYYTRGCALQHLGRIKEAIASFRAAIARDPIHLDAHHDLNQLLYRLGRDDEFLVSYDEALGRAPNAGVLALAKAKLLFQRGDYENARESYERATALLPESAAAHGGLALATARSGQPELAIKEHELALTLAPNDSNSACTFAETLLRIRDPRKAREIAERAVSLAPDNQYALAMWGLAARAIDDAREQELNDYEGLVQVFEIDPPAGYDSIISFNRDLDRALDGLHRDQREFLGQSLRGGTQTLDNLFGAGHPLFEALRGRIDEAIAAYMARMKEDAEHPLRRRRTGAFQYAGSWSARLSDCGFHANHVHPKGWISSAYYVAVPDAVADKTSKQGWIKFGEPDFDAGFADPVRRAIQPRPGTLVLFPSYMWHGTIPFHSAQSRTTIAFDAVPR